MKGIFMKFNWGTGIFIFMALFLTAAAVFIVFAYRQNIDLVHDDYYERGVDHTNQMEIDARSAKYMDIVQAQLKDEALVIGFSKLLEMPVDSANLLLYRPSDSKLDIDLPLDVSQSSWAVSREDLSSGRYILDLTWYSGGLQYEVKKDVIVGSKQ